MAGEDTHLPLDARDDDDINIIGVEQTFRSHDFKLQFIQGLLLPVPLISQLLFLQLPRLLHCLIYGARHPEGLLWKGIVFSIKYFLETTYRLFNGNVAAFRTGESCGRALQ